MFHRIEELEWLPAQRFFRYAERLMAYNGAVQARAANLRARDLAQEQPQTQQVASARRGLRDGEEYLPDGTRLLHGVAVDENDVPLWVKRRPIMQQSQGGIEVIPGDAASLGFSQAFQGQFSYARVGVSGDQR